MTSFFDNRIFREASHENGFSGNRIDRQSEHRAEDCVARALGDPAARIYLFAGDQALLAAESDTKTALFDRKAAEARGMDADSLILLGFSENGPRLAAQSAIGEEECEADESLEAINLRALAIQGLVGREDLGAIAQARSLLHWHANHRFCAGCGAVSEMQGGGIKRRCPSCEREHFPRIDPVSIMLAINGDRCVLGRSPRFAPGMYSCLAGFIEPGETIEDAVRREIQEESGIRVGRVDYFSSQPWPFPSSLMIGCHAEALSTDIAPDEDELEDCRWFPREEVRLMLAGEHPDGLVAPPRMAIANRIIAAFAEAG
jgi:NAD+ diphosphatase